MSPDSCGQTKQTTKSCTTLLQNQGVHATERLHMIKSDGALLAAGGGPVHTACRERWIVGMLCFLID